MDAVLGVTLSTHIVPSTLQELHLLGCEAGHRDGLYSVGRVEATSVTHQTRTYYSTVSHLHNDSQWQCYFRSAKSLHPHLYYYRGLHTESSTQGLLPQKLRKATLAKLSLEPEFEMLQNCCKPKCNANGCKLHKVQN